MTAQACCSPSRPGGSSASVAAGAAAGAGDGAAVCSEGVVAQMVEVPAGTFLMGTSDDRFPADREGPVREIATETYLIASHLVTNDEFAAFVKATGLITLAESDGWSFVFAGVLPDDFCETRGVVGAEWWRVVEGGDWQHPAGPQSNLEGLGTHPVVHVTWTEAAAYAAWVGGRLPSEVEWERAARGGLEQATFAWGDELTPGGVHQCNIWQGTFPTRNTLDDQWFATSPVGSYPPNGFGLYDTAGNVWEWCADWFDEGRSRVIRGGSYLCHDSYCNRYRVGARSSNTPDTCTANMGIRIAADPAT